jgi:3,4-dihydroxy-2-butanone 4-phosphate synthase
MARRDDCRKFADQHGLKMISIEQLVEYRMALESGRVTSFASEHTLTN